MQDNLKTQHFKNITLQYIDRDKFGHASSKLGMKYVIKDLEASVPDLCKANKVGKWESTINYELDKMIVETAEIIFNIAINRLIDVSLKEKVSHEKMTFNSLDDILNDDSALFDNSGQSLNSKLFDTGSLNAFKKSQENVAKNKSREKQWMILI